jgi:hypothetical protein
VSEKSRRDYRQRLFQSHLAVVQALADLYNPPLGTSFEDDLARAHRGLDELLSMLEREQCSPAAKEDAALLYRAVERGLALAAIVDCQLRRQHRTRNGAKKSTSSDSKHGAFEGELRDGYRLLKLIFDARPVRWSLLIESGDLPDEVVSGVVADNLRLVEELLGSASGNNVPWSNVKERWTSLHRGSEKYLGSDRYRDGALSWLSRPELRANLGISAKELRTWVKERRILEATDWSGSPVYPTVQLVENNTQVAPGLAELLKLLRPDRLSAWHLALWLSLPLDDGQISAIDQLAVDIEPALKVLRRFRAVGTLSDTASDPPTVAELSTVRASSTTKSKTGKAKPMVLYRVVDSRYGPFFFSKDSSRFDPPGWSHKPRTGAPFGTCYTSLDPAGAYSETMMRSPIVDLDTILQTTIWELSPQREMTELLDLANYQQLDPQLDHTVSRDSTQRLAHNAWRSGYRGLIHRLYQHPSGRGVALFGRPGRSAPESSNHPSFRATATPIVDDEQFWDWLRPQDGTKRISLWREQLPSTAILRKPPSTKPPRRTARATR